MQNNPYPDLIAAWRDPRRELRSTVRVLAIVAAVVLCFTILFTQIFIGVQVVGSSMEPTLYGGDYLFVDTTAGIRRAQGIFLLPQTGVTDRATWEALTLFHNSFFDHTPLGWMDETP